VKSFVKVMKALSDPNRVKIVKLLQNKSLCVCELTEALGLAQPTVSKHLKILEEAGFVYSIKTEKWVDYSLSDGKESPYVATLLGSMRHWLDGDMEIHSLVTRLPTIRRETICSRKNPFIDP
jgi:ArsR family transcriptional regulator